MGPVMYLFINKFNAVTQAAIVEIPKGPKAARRAKYQDPEKPDSFSIGRLYWFVYGALLKQGSTAEPKSSTYSM